MRKPQDDWFASCAGVIGIFIVISLVLLLGDGAIGDLINRVGEIVNQMSQLGRIGQP